MMRAEEIRRRRREDPPGTHTAVNNILAAAAREMEEAMHASRGGERGERVVASIQTEHDQGTWNMLNFGNIGIFFWVFVTATLVSLPLFYH